MQRSRSPKEWRSAREPLIGDGAKEGASLEGVKNWRGAHPDRPLPPSATSAGESDDQIRPGILQHEGIAELAFWQVR